MHKLQHPFSAIAVVVSILALSLVAVLLPDSISIGLEVHASANAYGPQTSIVCPDGSITIAPGQEIPSVGDAAPAGSTFCILAGTHNPTSPIMPKAGDK